MKCISCGGKAGYNRVAIALEGLSPIGGFCVGCEASVFGERLSAMTVQNTKECSLCDDDPTIALPEWYAVPSTEEGVTTISNDYEITTTTIRLCERHVDAIRGLTKPGSPAQTDGINE